MINLQQITTFCTVVNEGSMTAAADKLFLTQPAVSQQIRSLEEELGVELLVKGIRKIKLTLQGQLLYEYSKKIIQLSQQAQIAIQTIGTELKGKIKVGTLNSIGLHLISPIVGLFLKYNNELQIKLEYSKGEDLIKSFEKGELDIIVLPDIKEQFGIDIPNIENVEKRFLMKDEMWLVGSGKDTNLPKRIKFVDFFSRPTVMFTGEYSNFMNFLKDEAKKHNMNSLEPVFESSNVGTLKRVIESGLGWGFLPTHCITKQIRSNRLVRIHIDDLSYEVDFNFYYKKDLHDLAIVDVFYRAIQHQSRAQN